MHAQTCVWGGGGGQHWVGVWGCGGVCDHARNKGKILAYSHVYILACLLNTTSRTTIVNNKSGINPVLKKISY